MLKLGNISYSNCFPVHAGILTGAVAFPFTIVDGMPTQLNRMLYEGVVDVSPSSSIEYAMNQGRYRILPGFSITSRTKAMSICLQSRVPTSELEEKHIALTTSSATSVVLLRILLEIGEGVSPNYFLYDQDAEEPTESSDAILTIGDRALRKKPTDEFPYLYDLGSLWNEFTGLPFVFALWQINYRKNIQRDLQTLSRALIESKQYGLRNLAVLASTSSERFGLSSDLLLSYWKSFSYDLDESEQKALMTFYGYAAEIGAIGVVPELHFWKP